MSGPRFRCRGRFPMIARDRNRVGDEMRQPTGILALGALAAIAAGGAMAEDSRPLADCAGAVGSWISRNPGDQPSRSLFSFTADGVVLFADSGQGGAANFAPFTGGHGAWRCVAADAGSLHVTATILDFTIATTAFPDQSIGRLDIDATLDPAKGAMAGTMTLSSDALDGDPLDAPELVEDAKGSFTAARINAP